MQAAVVSAEDEVSAAREHGPDDRAGTAAVTALAR